MHTRAEKGRRCLPGSRHAPHRLIIRVLNEMEKNNVEDCSDHGQQRSLYPAGRKGARNLCCSHAVYDRGQDFLEEFYAQMESGANIVTSQPSPSAVMDIWDKALETHDEVVYIPMSSGLSGSCQSARMLADDYDGKVQVVNNQRISVTQKRSVQDALEMAQRGMSAAQIRQELEHVKYESSIYIMLDTLYYLKKGGRITPAAAAVGTLLRIKPVLQIKGGEAGRLFQSTNHEPGEEHHDQRHEARH